MKVCAEPGCPDLSDSTYCPEHTKQRRANQRRASYRAWTVKQHKTARWKNKRKAQLHRQPYCQSPIHRGLMVKANTADHIEPHRGNAFKFWNGELQSLCPACHSGWKQSLEHDASTRPATAPGGGGYAGGSV